MESANEAPFERPISSEEFERMASAGIFGPEERVELLNGRLRTMPPPSPEHGYAVTRLVRILIEALGADVTIAAQNAARLSALSMPQPDIVIARGPDERYAHAHPEAADIIAVVEVSCATLSYDRGEKLRAYVDAGIPEYWIVDVKRGTVTVCTQPRDGAYASVRTFSRTERAALVAFPHAPIAVASIVPPHG